MQAANKNVLSCWLGGSSVAQARQVFADAGLPTYDTPEKAVNGFLQIAQYRRNQELLMEVPAAGHQRRRALDRARPGAGGAGAGRSGLSDADARALMAAYGIALATPQQAALAGATLAAAHQITIRCSARWCFSARAASRPMWRPTARPACRR
jgi:acetyl-CoA synthetase (ADP-forming)/acetyltransferase